MMSQEPKPVDRVIADTHDRSPDTRADALLQLMSCSPASPAMIVAAGALLGDTAGTTPKQYLSSFAPAVGAYACTVIHKLVEQTPEVIEGTLRLIPSLRGYERLGAMDAVCAAGATALQRAIERMGSDAASAVPILEAILRERQGRARVCATAIRVLGRLGNLSETGIKALIGFAGEHTLEAGAESQIGGYGLVGAFPIEDMLSPPSAEAATALGRIGAPAFPALNEALQSEATAPFAIRALELAGSDAILLLVDGLRSESREARALAIAALASIAQQSGHISYDAIKAMHRAVEREEGWLRRYRLGRLVKKAEKTERSRPTYGKRPEKVT